MKFKLWFLGITILVGLSACSGGQQMAMDGTDKNDPSIAVGKAMFEKPPGLKVEIDGKEVTAISGGYHWSYFDQKEDAMALVEKETLSAIEIGVNQKAPSVNIDTAIELNFAQKPDSYKVTIWNSDHRMKGPYKKIVLDESVGKTVYEVAAVWEQGTAHYIFALTIE